MPNKIQLRTIQGGLLEISGATFYIKDQLKRLGCRWQASSKSWIVGERPALRTTLEQLIDENRLSNKKKPRLCGFCRKPGHTQGSCDQKRVHLIAQRCRQGPGYKYMRLRGTDHCQCTYGPLAETCFNCNHWCCAAATPVPDDPNRFTAFTCRRHGTGIEQLLNDTRGT